MKQGDMSFIALTKLLKFPTLYSDDISHRNRAIPVPWGKM